MNKSAHVYRWLLLTALVLLITQGLLRPPVRDLAFLGGFLLASGGLTLLLGLGSAHDRHHDRDVRLLTFSALEVL